MRTVVILSGGLDSTVTAAQLLHDGHDLYALAIDYGQRHQRELDSAGAVATALGIPIELAQLQGLRPLLAGSALTTGSVPVPAGHYAEPSMKTTIVPNRNAILLSVAYGYAISVKADQVAFGAHSGDHFIYPDCRPEFVDALRAALRAGSAGVADVEVVAPFLHHNKTHIARVGHQLSAPLHLTYSCYRGDTNHCGTCGTCTERREAFHDAGVPDPTTYDHDPTHEDNTDNSSNDHN